MVIMLSDNWHLVCVLLASLLVVVVTYYWVFSRRNPRCCSNGSKLPPGSMGFPLIGETIQFLLPSNSIDTPAFIKTRVQKYVILSRRYGPLFKTSLMGRRIVVSTDPDFSYNLLLQEGKLVERTPISDTTAQVLSHVANSKNSVFHTYKLLMQPILSRFGYESLKNGTLMAELEETVSTSLHRWSQLPQVELKTATSTMVLNFMTKKLFSYEPSQVSQSEELADSFANFFQELLKFPINIPGITSWRRCFKVQKKFEAIIAETLKNRKRSLTLREKKEDYLNDILTMMQNEDLILTDDFIINMIFGISLASFEAISSTIVVALKFLLENSLIIQKLQEENKEILKSRKVGSKSGLSWEEYKSMTYTRHVIKESLRMSSVAPGILRTTLTDIDVDGYIIPKGWAVLVVPSAIQLNSTVYENPLSFNPSRWEGMSERDVAQKFIAFGGGARSCVGSELTKVLMTIFLHILITKYSWKNIKAGKIARTPVLGFGDGLHVQFQPLSAHT